MGKRQNGFAFLQILLLIAVVAAVGLIGLKVANNRASLSSQSPTSTTDQQAALSSSVSPAPEIKKTDDLDKAAKILDQNDPESANQLDSSEIDDDSLDF